MFACLSQNVKGNKRLNVEDVLEGIKEGDVMLSNASLRLKKRCTFTSPGKSSEE